MQTSRLSATTSFQNSFTIESAELNGQHTHIQIFSTSTEPSSLSTPQIVTSDLQANNFTATMSEGKTKDKIEISGDAAARSGNEAATAFTLFPKLPPELRCQIWKFTEPERRFITVVVRPHICGNVWRLHALVKSRSFKFACRESRAEFRKSYILIKGTDPPSRAIYCNPIKDVLCFDLYSTYYGISFLDFFNYLSVQNFRPRSLAVDTLPLEFYFKKSFTVEVLSCPCVENVMVVWGSTAKDKSINRFRNLDIIDMVENEGEYWVSPQGRAWISQVNADVKEIKAIDPKRSALLVTVGRLLRG